MLIKLKKLFHNSFPQVKLLKFNKKRQNPPFHKKYRRGKKYKQMKVFHRLCINLYIIRKYRVEKGETVEKYVNKILHLFLINF